MSLNEFLTLVGEQSGPQSWEGMNERYEFHKISFVASNDGQTSGAITHITIEGLNVVSGIDGKKEKVSSFRLCDEKNTCGPITLSPKEVRTFVGYGSTWKSYGPIRVLSLNVAIVDVSGIRTFRVFKQQGIADQRGNAQDLSQLK